MTEEEFAELSAGAALGALSADDMRAYRAALAEHPEWAGRVEEDAATAASLAELADDVPPPAALRDDILVRIAGLPQGGSVGSERRGDATVRPGSDASVASERVGDASVPLQHPHRDASAPRQHPQRDASVPPRAGRSWGRRAWFALAASVVLLVGIGAGAIIAVQHASRPAAVVALDDIEAAPDAQQATADVEGGGQATLHWSPSLGKAVLVVGDLPELADDKTFELWYVRGQTPIAAGTFEATGASTSALLDAGMRPGDVVAVTVEQSGGSPTGRPTTQPIVAIPTA